MSNPVVWFEVMGQDTAKLRSFYSQLLSWKFNSDNPMDYGFVETGDEGIEGGIGEAPRGRGLGDLLHQGPGPRSRCHSRATVGEPGQGPDHGTAGHLDRRRDRPGRECGWFVRRPSDGLSAIGDDRIEASRETSIRLRIAAILGETSPDANADRRGRSLSKEVLMRRADRLFRLVQYLRAQRAATGQEIAEELEVSVRTVYRDIVDLQTSGIPIRGEAGVGYRLEAGFELPPLTFTNEELEGLALGARIVASWGDPALAAAVNSAIKRIEGVLPATLRRVLIETPLFAPQYRQRADLISRGMSTLRSAIGECRALHIRYADAEGRESQRDVLPLGLHFWGNKWTLAAFCELRGDYRSFRPDRIREIEVLDRTFDPDDKINLAGFLSRVEDSPSS